jgi:hypothetical protein
MVTKKIEISQNISSIPDNQNYFDEGAEQIHVSYGAGLRIAMNENFIIKFDYGRVTDKRDGDSGTYIALNYLF